MVFQQLKEETTALATQAYRLGQLLITLGKQIVL